MPEENEPAETGEPSSITPQAFSQDDMTRVAAREKDQGKRQGQREVLEALGFGSLDEARDFAKLLKDAEAAQLSEVERAKRDAEKAKSEAESIKAEAKRDRYMALVERELLKEGIDLNHVAKLSKLVEADVNSSPEDIATAVADLKADMPSVFGIQDVHEEPGAQNSGTPTPPASDPGKAPGTKPSADPSKRASERLKARHGDRLKNL
jgi:hypothetical protein